jgi:flagellar biosynthesis protein FliP
MLVFLLINSKSYAKPVVSFELSGFDSETMSEPGDVASSIQILFIITILGLAPSIIIMMTSFTRIIIVLSFLRNAIGTQQMPPNQVLIGLALFLTLFVMMPIGQEINDKALVPYTQGDINQESALNKSSDIIKGFMLRQFKNEKDLELFTRLAKIEIPVRPEELPLTVVIPAFLISELTIAFKIGFLIYIPFLIIDMVVASTLMSMGMLMLPPIMISLPFKILLFIMVDGWHMITETVIGGFT